MYRVVHTPLPPTVPVLTASSDGLRASGKPSRCGESPWRTGDVCELRREGGRLSLLAPLGQSLRCPRGPAVPCPYAGPESLERSLVSSLRQARLESAAGQARGAADHSGSLW